MMGVCVEIFINEGMDEEFLEAMEVQGKNVTHEPGFMYADLYRTNTPGRYLMVEVYEDRDTLYGHQDFEHTKEFARLKGRFEAAKAKAFQIYPIYSEGPLKREIGAPAIGPGKT